MSARKATAAGPSTDLHDEAAHRLAAVDQRYTTKRKTLIDALADSSGPLSIQELLTAAPGVPQSSAYRNLAVLVEAGVVRRVQGSDDNGRFELAEDLSSHHHHLICTQCGLVVDIAIPPKLEGSLAAAARAAADASGFAVEEHRFDVLGRCVNCR